MPATPPCVCLFPHNQKTNHLCGFIMADTRARNATVQPHAVRPATRPHTGFSPSAHPPPLVAAWARDARTARRVEASRTCKTRPTAVQSRPSGRQPAPLCLTAGRAGQACATGLASRTAHSLTSPRRFPSPVPHPDGPRCNRTALADAGRRFRNATPPVTLRHALGQRSNLHQMTTPNDISAVQEDSSTRWTG